MIINGIEYEKITNPELGNHSKYILLYEDRYDHPAHNHGYFDVTTRNGGLPNQHRTKDLTLISEKKKNSLPYDYSIVFNGVEWILSSSRGWKLWGGTPIIDLDEDDNDCI